MTLSSAQVACALLIVGVCVGLLLWIIIVPAALRTDLLVVVVLTAGGFGASAVSRRNSRRTPAHERHDALACLAFFVGVAAGAITIMIIAWAVGVGLALPLVPSS
ncbi:MAG: hypothetical protein KGJ23_12635 [Euryarchaeota archaeon]|nr:hypothetical protein [Euryarchaeota archaeon]MDE1837445.1 hypothetical protein [Euryarchaeota archaeon]MDE1882008.1 hypothetical protein [Euryarchaeota archaeon]MDE2045589.1 hypothetical protein [Thermoplasmata archaeon]